MDSRINRREFCKISALAGVAVLVAACSPKAAPSASKSTEVAKAPEDRQVGYQGEIVFYPQSLMPTSEIPNAAPNAVKREALKVLSQQWAAIHPGVTITFMPHPEGDYFAWLPAQIAGGTGPDIYWIWLGVCNQYANSGQAVPLDDYLELPNKHTPEDTSAWKYSFKDPFLTLAMNKHYGGIPIDLVATGVYANVDMLKQVGIDVKKEIVPELSSPKDWATMISWCQKLVDGGFLAMSAGMGVINQWWITGVLSDQFLHSWIAKYDLLNHQKNILTEFQQGILSQEEVVHAYYCMGLDVFAAPEVRDMFRVIADWCKYMPPGFASADYGQPMELFLTNKLGMVWDGSWSVGTILQDSRRKFEFTSFWLPPVTQATSEYVPDPPFLPIGVGGYGTISYALSPTTITKGCVDECVDWLMYLTTPDNNALIVNEVPSTIPSQKKAKSLPEVENLFVGETRFLAGGFHPVTSPYGWFGFQEGEWGNLLRREQTLYYLGEQGADSFFANLKSGGDFLSKGLIRGASIQYTKDGAWDLAQWKCQPAV
ncbi:MAG: ABC transporter substrate-binding protein [Anaerolineae bacterium]